MKYYKVYENFDEHAYVGLNGKVCVGIFKSEGRAKYLCYVIDVQDFNKTEIVFDNVKKQDLLDLHKCFKGSDCEDEIITLTKEFLNEELTK